MMSSRSAPSAHVVVGKDKKHRSQRSLDKNTTDTGVLSSSDADDEDYCLSQDVAARLEGRVSHTVSSTLSRFPFVREHHTLNQLPRFSQQDIHIGDLVAKGGFSNVHAVTFQEGFEIDKDPHGSSSYVIKHLNPRLALNTRKLVSGAKDLVLEAHMLSAVCHENILPLRGWSSSGVSSFVSTGRVDSFFLIFDRLDATLFQRMGEWRKTVRHDTYGILNDLHKRKKYPETMELYQQRLQIAYDITKALTYLHEHNIFHMDLKPGNVGFDRYGAVKLFDFGLAVEVQPVVAVDVVDDDDDGDINLQNQTYDLKGKKGTSRYMAPEVIRRERYNAKADVYSFAILLWEMLSLTKPYDELDGTQVKEYVSRMGLRPKIPKNWPQQIRLLIKYSWAKRADDRPTMLKIRDFLAKVLFKKRCPSTTTSAPPATSSPPPASRRKSTTRKPTPTTARPAPAPAYSYTPATEASTGATSAYKQAGSTTNKFLKLRAKYNR